MLKTNAIVKTKAIDTGNQYFSPILYLLEYAVKKKSMVP